MDDNNGIAVIEFTPEKVESLKKAYEDAVENKKEQFTWDGKEFLTDYAKYLLQYIFAIGPEDERSATTG